MALETPSRPPPPFMANAILNFHFDFLKPSLSSNHTIITAPVNTCDQITPRFGKCIFDP